MLNSAIRKINYYLPENVVTNQHLESEFPGWEAQKVCSKIGIQHRHVAKEDETSLDLAIKAAELVLDKYDRNQIDFVLLCTQSPDYYLPTSACILQNKLALRTGIGALDFNLGCSGYVYGLAIAKGLIAAGTANNILFVVSETYSKFIHPKDRSNRSIFGDGAAATIIERTSDGGILNFVLGTDGSGCKNLIVPNGGFRSRFDPNAKEIEYAPGSINTCNHLYMNGPEIFNFTINAIPKVFDQILQANKLTLDDIDLVVFHQANKYMLEYLRDKLKIPENKFFIDLHKTGNTVSATIPIALKNCLDKQSILPGSKVLLMGFGVGYSWGGTVIKF